MPVVNIIAAGLLITRIRIWTSKIDNYLKIQYSICMEKSAYVWMCADACFIWTVQRN